MLLAHVGSCSLDEHCGLCGSTLAHEPPRRTHQFVEIFKVWLVLRLQNLHDRHRSVLRDFWYPQWHSAHRAQRTFLRLARSVKYVSRCLAEVAAHFWLHARELSQPSYNKVTGHSRKDGYECQARHARQLSSHLMSYKHSANGSLLVSRGGTKGVPARHASEERAQIAVSCSTSSRLTERIQLEILMHVQSIWIGGGHTTDSVRRTVACQSHYSIRGETREPDLHAVNI